MAPEMSTMGGGSANLVKRLPGNFQTAGGQWVQQDHGEALAADAEPPAQQGGYHSGRESCHHDILQLKPSNKY